MKFHLLIVILLFCSCGIVATIKRNKYIESKGFDPQKDTSFIGPYQYYIKHKGYIPLYRELNPANKLDEKISIKGFENVDTIPIEKLFNPMTFVLHDTTLAFNYGELYFSRSGYGQTLKFGQQFPDTCLCRAFFHSPKPKFRSKRKGDLLFFWNVSVIKNGITYAIPSRTYELK